MIFRYPGGKTKLLDEIIPILKKMGVYKSSVFVDAFCGGGSVSLKTVNDINLYLSSTKIIMNDKDEYISAFWEVLSDKDTNNLMSLLQKVGETIPTTDMFYSIQESNPTNIVEKAFKALFLNRTSFSGIMKASPIGGKKQLSAYKVGCRWNTNSLLRDIKTNSTVLRESAVTVLCLDIFDMLHRFNDNDTILYLDPPYIKQGHSLYPVYMTMEEHEKLSTILRNRNNWLLSIDNCKESLEIYSWADISYIDSRYSIRGSKKTWTDSKELLISPKI